ncbi:MAG: DinB family protein [Chloroflexota bacterium]|jgi:hypothetical protein
MPNDQVLREQILQLLTGRNAHYTFEDAVADFPMEAINRRPPNVAYTPWHLVEHLRIAQWDILEFMRDPDHVSPDWPKGYWPDPQAATNPAGWQQSLDRFRADLAAVESMVRDPELDITAELPHAAGYTYLREFLLVADHNAYHIGEFAILRQIMSTWPES